MEVQCGEWPTILIWINYRLFRVSLLRPLVLVINMTAPILFHANRILKISDIIK